MRQLKRRLPNLKLIILSVHDEPTVVKEVMASDAAGFVLKRSAATDLILAVKEVLKDNRYISPSVRV